ncbi:MAG: aldehyde dehydrogenase [Alphaproteobacteria bacterium]|nr:aldehyde dehydrogenase [Alphaproteobacteria bacterium]MCB9929772.1 aldehyde dehydrogenase [Alphaproteobacteria bacterium]
MAALNRRDLVAKLLADRGEDLLVVTGLGQATYDCFAAGDDPRTFYLWGAMGGALPVGMGLAVAQPEKRVLVVTGDGELLMGLGALAAAAAEGLPNLAVAVLDNERYGETGQQQTATGRGTDLTGMAAAAGFAATKLVTDAADVAEGVRLCREAQGPVLVTFKVDHASQEMVLPPKDGAFLKTRFRQAVLGKI